MTQHLLTYRLALMNWSFCMYVHTRGELTICVFWKSPEVPSNPPGFSHAASLASLFSSPKPAKICRTFQNFLLDNKSIYLSITPAHNYSSWHLDLIDQEIHAFTKARGHSGELRQLRSRDRYDCLKMRPKLGFVLVWIVQRRRAPFFLFS